MNEDILVVVRKFHDFACESVPELRTCLPSFIFSDQENKLEFGINIENARPSVLKIYLAAFARSICFLNLYTDTRENVFDTLNKYDRLTMIN